MFDDGVFQETPTCERDFWVHDVLHLDLVTDRKDAEGGERKRHVIQGLLRRYPYQVIPVFFGVKRLSCDASCLYVPCHAGE